MSSGYLKVLFGATAIVIPLLHHLAAAEEGRVPKTVQLDQFPRDSRAVRCLSGCHVERQPKTFGIPSDPLHEIVVGLRR